MVATRCEGEQNSAKFFVINKTTIFDGKMIAESSERYSANFRFCAIDLLLSASISSFHFWDNLRQLHYCDSFTFDTVSLLRQFSLVRSTMVALFKTLLRPSKLWASSSQSQLAALTMQRWSLSIRWKVDLSSKRKREKVNERKKMRARKGARMRERAEGESEKEKE